jgi:hypothetical protein
MSLSDFDLPFRSRFSSTLEMFMKLMLLSPRILNDIGFHAVLYGLAFGLYSFAPYQFAIIFLIFGVGGLLVIYFGLEDFVPKDDTLKIQKSSTEYDDDEYDDFVDLEVVQKPSSIFKKPSVAVDLFNTNP